LYDLSYDRHFAGFLNAAPEGCIKMNGERMLYLQAEAAWHIFRE
ncbi:MAG: shikimate dehydrogenase, partial [Clostridiales bacterium]